MTYTRELFGKELKERVMRQEDLKVIGEWAYSVYLDYNVDPDFDDLLLILARMGDEPEFAYSYEELNQIADDLISGKDVKL